MATEGVGDATLRDGVLEAATVTDLGAGAGFFAVVCFKEAGLTGLCLD